MRGRPGSVRSLEEFGRVRLSASFFMRDFLHSEIADFNGIPNIPDAPDLAIAAGRKLCEQLLEPLQATFGRLAIRSAYRAPAVNEFGNRHGLSCASNLRNYGRHIWDRRDAAGAMGAMATLVVPAGLQDAPDFGEAAADIAHRTVKDDVPRQHIVEALASEGQRVGIGLAQAQTEAARGRLAASEVEAGGGTVDRLDGKAVLGEEQRVPADAATEVEHMLRAARLQHRY
jgi:hypothetical protein